MFPLIRFRANLTMLGLIAIAALISTFWSMVAGKAPEALLMPAVVVFLGCMALEAVFLFTRGSGRDIAWRVFILSAIPLGSYLHSMTTGEPFLKAVMFVPTLLFFIAIPLFALRSLVIVSEGFAAHSSSEQSEQCPIEQA
jgi:hypothetical protein